MAEPPASESSAVNAEMARLMDSVVVRFSGDSGDGMQLTGDQFTNTSAVLGNDISTFPDFPAEIRAPAGTLAGLSGFQVNLAASDIYTAGDAPLVLVAMNPAALAANLADLEPGGVVIVNEDAFTRNNLRKAGYDANPLDDESYLQGYELHRVPLTTMTRAAAATEPRRWFRPPSSSADTRPPPRGGPCWSLRGSRWARSGSGR